MSRLGQFDFYDSFDTSGFVDTGDWSTDVFDWGAVDLDYGWDTALPDVYAGADDWFSYDMPTSDTIGYDVADPLYGESVMDATYDSSLTMADDYGDLYAPSDYGLTDFDPATGVGIGDETLTDWTAWEESGAAELEAATGGSVETAIATFSTESPDVDWQYWVDKGADIYKMYQKMQLPTAAPGAPKPTYMVDPRTGQPVLAIRDPRTGQLVPAARDPRTGQLVPASSLQQAGIIPGVPNTLLLAGVGLAAFFLFR